MRLFFYFHCISDHRVVGNASINRIYTHLQQPTNHLVDLVLIFFAIPRSDLVVVCRYRHVFVFDVQFDWKPTPVEKLVLQRQLGLGLIFEVQSQPQAEEAAMDPSCCPCPFPPFVLFVVGETKIKNKNKAKVSLFIWNSR